MEVLLFTQDKSADAGSYKRGDVITIQDDNWPWSAVERTRQDWRIVRVPILAVQAEALLAKSLLPNVARKREWTIDFSLLPNPALFTGARTQEIITLTRQQVAAASSRKP